MAEATHSARRPWVRDVTRDSVRHFAWGVGDNNPLWVDPEYAQKSRWQGIIAPPCFPYAVHETTVAPGFDGRPRIYGSCRWQWFDVIRLGAPLIPSITAVDTLENDRGVTQTGTVDFGEGPAESLARVTTTCLRPAGQGSLAPTRPGRRYTDRELADIEQAVLSESRRGDQVRYWEDTACGERLGPLTKGPLSIMDIVAWCAGALGVPAADAGVSAGGLVEEAATGPQLTAWFAQLITDWAGDEAFLHRLDVTIGGQPGLGSTAFLNGAVTHRWAVEGMGIVQLKLRATDQEDRGLATGTALLVLASRDRGPVPLPISHAVERNAP